MIMSPLRVGLRRATDSDAATGRSGGIRCHRPGVRRVTQPTPRRPRGCDPAATVTGATARPVRASVTTASALTVTGRTARAECRSDSESEARQCPSP